MVSSKEILERSRTHVLKNRFLAMILGITTLSVLLIITSYFLRENDLNYSNEKNDVPRNDWLLHSENFASNGSRGSCLVLQEHLLIYPPPTLETSPDFLAALREYEAMHKYCVMNVSDWRMHFVRSQRGLQGCKYLVWKPPSGGLGNHFVSLLGAFEYALLTNRAILVQRTHDIDQLICNPLESSSIWLPKNFPLSKLRSAPLIGDFVEENLKYSKKRKPGARRKDIAFAHLKHSVDGRQHAFFCQQVQDALEQVTWLLYISNQYVGPALFYVSSFESVLMRWFPDRRVTNHIARYLLLPTNKIWLQIRTQYRAHFAFATTRVGVQIRTFGPYKAAVSERIVECLNKMDIIRTGMQSKTATSKPRKLNNGVTFLFVTSLDHEYSQDLKKALLRNKSLNHNVVAVYPKGHQGKQSNTLEAKERAMAEIWLLSMTDVLLTSDGSTFGYIASALHNEREAYFMHNEEGIWDDETPVCSKKWSGNACYHVPPRMPFCGAQETEMIFEGKPVNQSVGGCQDKPKGLSVVPLL